MNVERLRQLDRVVRDAPVLAFNMTRFTTKHRGGCGTAHCASGWAALDPWFQQNTEIGTIFEVTAAGHVLVRDSGRPTTFLDLARMFDVSRLDADFLFGGQLEPRDAPLVGKKEVLDNIARLLAGEKPFPYPKVRS